MANNQFYQNGNIPMSVNMLITPIRKNKKANPPCSRTDWEEQLKRCNNNKQMMWDDSAKNKSKKGDIFVVWQHEKPISFHYITEVRSNSDRLPSWTNNVGQSDRQVIYIDPAFATISWKEWISLGGHKRCMGTAAIITAKVSLLCKLNRMMCERSSSLDLVGFTNNEVKKSYKKRSKKRKKHNKLKGPKPSYIAEPVKNIDTDIIGYCIGNKYYYVWPPHDGEKLDERRAAWKAEYGSEKNTL